MQHAVGLFTLTTWAEDEVELPREFRAPSYGPGSPVFGWRLRNALKL